MAKVFIKRLSVFIDSDSGRDFAVKLAGVCYINTSGDADDDKNSEWLEQHRAENPPVWSGWFDVVGGDDDDEQESVEIFAEDEDDCGEKLYIREASDVDEYLTVDVLDSNNCVTTHNYYRLMSELRSECCGED